MSILVDEGRYRSRRASLRDEFRHRCVEGSWRPYVSRQSWPMSIFVEARRYRSRRASLRDECVEGSRRGRRGNTSPTAATSPLERERMDRLPVLLGAEDDRKRDDCWDGRGFR
jgi:hypothetical protein